jgi:hypothetical protein
VSSATKTSKGFPGAGITARVGPVGIVAHPVIVANKMMKSSLAFILNSTFARELEVHRVRQVAEVLRA